MTTNAEFANALNRIANAFADGARNLMIKLSGGHTDNEYADAMMREHRAAVTRQLSRKASTGYPINFTLPADVTPQDIADRLARDLPITIRETR